jgi:hypothetical protein
MHSPYMSGAQGIEKEIAGATYSIAGLHRVICRLDDPNAIESGVDKPGVSYSHRSFAVSHG